MVPSILRFVNVTGNSLLKNLCGLCEIYTCTKDKCLVASMQIFTFISNFTDITITPKCHYNANEVSKCFFLRVFKYFRQL